MISILDVSLSSKIQLTQGQMGWNCDLNIYNFLILSFWNSQFLKAEINSQVTVVNLNENENSKSFIFFRHLALGFWREAM